MDITFSNDPKLYILLPLLYHAWEDDILTKKEFSVIAGFIDRQDWLTKAEKSFLRSKIESDSPPSRSELFHWKEIIDNIIGTVHLPVSLTDLGILIANSERESFTSEQVAQIAPDLTNLESELGIMGPEIIASLKKNQSTITGRHTTLESFSVKGLTSILDDQQADVIQAIKKIISSPKFKLDTIANVAAYREKVFEWSKLLAKDGYGAYAYPTAYGGKDDIEGYFAIMETLSYHDLSLVIKFGVQFGLWGMSIMSLGTEKHYRKYLKNIGTLELPGGFAMTETHHGSNVKGIQTTATYNHADRTFTIHTPQEYARKEYIGNAAVHGEMMTVFAKLIIDETDYGVNAFIVPIRDKDKNILFGITIEDCGHKMGLNGVDNGIITFNNVVIPYENMLDRFAQVNDKGVFESVIPSDNRRFFTMLGTLVGGRIGIPRSALAAAKTGLTIAIKYADKRCQFGPEDAAEVPILNYRMHQQRLMPYLANAFALHFGLQYLTARFANRTDDDMQGIEALAAGMKAYATWNTRDALQECREACGGKGYISENRLDSLKNDTEVYTTFEGDNTVLMQLVAKNRLGEYRKQFGEMNMSILFNYVLEEAKTVVTEKNPFATRNTDEEHLKDLEFHRHAFQYREKELTASAARRFKRLIDDGLEAFDAANVMHPHMLELANAYIERILIEEFQTKLEQVDDVPIREVLTRVYQLFALHKIEDKKAWYLEQGYMEAVKTKAIRKLAAQLCWEIRQDAVPLVDAFDIPESCLAPIVTNKAAEA